MVEAIIIAFGINHLWQGAVVALSLQLLLAPTRNWSARLRYRFALTSMFAALVLPLAGFLPGADLFRGWWMPFVSRPTWLHAEPLPGAVGEQAGSWLSPGLTEAFGSVLLMLWIGGALFFLILLMRDIALTLDLRRRAFAIELAKFPGLTVAISAAAAGPMVVGYFNPVILLPIDFAERYSSDDLHAILEHERAHICRGDASIVLLQRLALAIFWWSPGLHWLSGRANDEREMACDEMAARRVGDPARVALALTSHAQTLIGPRQQTLALGAGSKPSPLGRRVFHLLAIRPNAPRRWQASAALGGFVAILAATALATPRVEGQQLPHVAAAVSTEPNNQQSTTASVSVSRQSSARPAERDGPPRFAPPAHPARTHSAKAAAPKAAAASPPMEPARRADAQAVAVSPNVTLPLAPDGAVTTIAKASSFGFGSGSGSGFSTASAGRTTSVVTSTSIDVSTRVFDFGISEDSANVH